MVRVIKATQLTTGADWDDTEITTVEIDDLDVAITQLRELKAQRDDLQLAFELQQERVIALMDERAETSHWTPFDNGWQATVVTGETVVYDDALICRNVTEHIWDTITDRKINRGKLERAVLDNEVPAEVVVEAATVKPRKPFIKLTEKHEADTDDR